MVSLCDGPIQSSAGWRFRFLGFPVRVHPYFWLSSLMLSGLGETGSVLLWVLACFVSILLHEAGHAAMMKLFGIRAEVILYSFGGVASPLDHRSRGPSASILIALAGPLAGFLFAALILLAVASQGAQIQVRPSPLLLPAVWAKLTPNPMPLSKEWYAGVLVNHLLWVNIWWGFVNLLPIWPLDGGHIARGFLERRYGSEGLRRSLKLSAITATVTAILAFTSRDMYLILFFGLMAAASMQMLEGLGPIYRPNAAWRR